MSSTENKLMKSVTDSAVVVGLAAGIGYLGKKLIKEPLISDPSSSITNYAKWVVVLGTSMYLKQYLEDKKIIPQSI